MEMILKTEEASKNFGGVWALRNVSFSVEPGEKLAIIGPNGAGKTTLMNVLNGLLPLSDGKIFLFGQDITHYSTHHRTQMGMARSFQSSSLFPEMRVIDNLLLAFQGMKASRYSMLKSFYSYPESNAEAEKLLKAVNLWPKRLKQVEFLSHGEKKKLEIITSFASNPKLLLLDEPSAGLTSEESAEIVEIIKKEGSDMAVLIVAHDMDLVFNLADEILVLHYGEVIAKGKPDAIMKDTRVRECYMGIGNE